MCGISVAIGKDEQKTTTLIKRMVEKQQHRGQHHQSYTTQKQGESYISLGHNLLQISGDEKQPSYQPIQSVCQRFEMVFNGQIFGHLAHRERKSLQGYPFRNTSDTETLIALLAVEGIAVLREIEGMFAIALYDKNTEILHLVRDRFGIKPLFYKQEQEEFYAASHLFAIPIEGKAEVQKESVAHYFAYKYAPVGKSILENIQELKPAGHLQVKEGKIIYNGYYQDISFKKPEDRKHIVQLRVLKAIQNQLERQIDKPQETALMLSGGVDSSILAVSIKDLGLEKQVPALTAVYESGEKGNDTDIAYAKEVAQRAGLQWIPVSYNDSLIEEIPLWVKTLSQPVADMAGLITWHLSKEEFFKGKVLLSGAGADELFLGYRRHKALYVLLELQKVISNSVARNLISGFAQAIFPSKSNEIKHFLSNVKPNDAHGSFIKIQQQLGFKESFLKINVPQGNFLAPQEKLLNSEYLQYASHIELANYLVGDILAVSDNAAMSFGKEIRLPYLSNELQQMLSKVYGMQLMELGQKYMLREILKERYAMKDIARRGKKGFGISWSKALAENTWAKNELKQLINSPYLKEIWKEKEMQMVINATLAGKKEYTQLALSMLIYHHWCLAHIQ